MLRYKRTDDWIILPQIPPRLPEHDAELHCMRGTADSGQLRQAAGAVEKAPILRRGPQKMLAGAARYRQGPSEAVI